MKIFRTLAVVALAFPLAAGIALAQQPAPSDMISMDRARAIALRQVPNNMGVKSAKLKTKDGMMVYEFDINTPGKGHSEVRVNAHTGAVVANKHEDNIVGKAEKDIARGVDKVFRRDEWKNVNPPISESRARAIAQSRVNGPIKDVDLERKNGVLVWEIDVDTRGPGHEEFQIDAGTGAILRQHHQDDIVGGTVDKLKH